jgi:hypothetical protein
MRSLAAPLLACALLGLPACTPTASNGTAPASSTAVTATPLKTGETPITTTPSLGRGDKAPAFSLEGSDGKTHALADHAGKEVVVVAWFPKAFTGG